MARWASQFGRRMDLKNRLAVSTHRKVLFFTIAGLQLLSSFVVLGIMVYFVSKLGGSHMAVPYVFILELGVTVTTVTLLSLSILVFYPATPPPTTSILLNCGILGIRGISFALLLNSMKSTLTSQCSINSWGNSTGVMVCRLYKTVFSFDIVALALTLISIALALFAYSSARSGAYIRTPNPKFDGVRNADEDSEYRGLTQGTPSIAPSSASLYSAAFKSPHTPDDKSLGFPSTPGLGDFGENAELNHLAPPKRDSRQIDGDHMY